MYSPSGNHIKMDTLKSGTLFWKFLFFFQKLTISPFGNSGGNQDIIIFVLEAGIAFMACGADGTLLKRDIFKQNFSFFFFFDKMFEMFLFTIFISTTIKRLRFNTIAHFGVCHHPYRVVSILL